MFLLTAVCCPSNVMLSQGVKEIRSPLWAREVADSPEHGLDLSPHIGVWRSLPRVSNWNVFQRTIDLSPDVSADGSSRWRRVRRCGKRRGSRSGCPRSFFLPAMSGARRFRHHSMTGRTIWDGCAAVWWIVWLAIFTSALVPKGLPVFGLRSNCGKWLLATCTRMRWPC